ncbi:major facilitator superfamily protein [Cryptosporidium serpentis]
MIGNKGDSLQRCSAEDNQLSNEAINPPCYRMQRFREHPHAIRFVFSWMLLTQTLRNYDTGALPVLLGVITEEFGLQNVQLGLLGAVPYIAAMFMAFIVNSPLQVSSQKWIITVSLIFLSVGLALMLASTSSALLFISRFIIGAMQAPLSIYMPVWIDEFTPPNKLTAWMGVSQITMIVGVAMGYLITGFTKGFHNGWRYSLVVPCVSLFMLSICLIFTNAVYFNVPYNRSKELKIDVEKISSAIANNIRFENESQGTSDIYINISEKKHKFSLCSTEMVESPNTLSTADTSKSSYGTNNEEYPSSSKSFSIIPMTKIMFDMRKSPPSIDSIISTSQSIDNDESRSYFSPIKTETKALNILVKSGNERTTVTIENSVSPSISHSVSLADITTGISPLSSSNRIFFGVESFLCTSKDKNSEIDNSRLKKVTKFFSFQRWKLLSENKIYILSVIVLSIIFYTVTAVQYWTTRFLQQTYNTNEGIILMSFSTTAGTAPTAGIIVSALLIDSIGGYKTPKGLFYTMLFCLGCSITATVFGIIALVIDHFFATIAGIWGLLFFGSFLVPPITGICVGVVELQMRQFAATVSMITYHILGFALGSVLPGALLQVTGVSRLGMTIVYGFPGIGIFFNLIACIIAFKKYKESGYSDKSNFL